MTTYNVTKKSKDFKIGDVVKMSDGGFMTAVVIKIDEKKLEGYKVFTMFRPYVHTSEVEYSNGIIPYTGFEQYEIYGSDCEYFCYETDKEIK